MTDDTLSKLLLSLVLFLTGSLLAFIIFCMFKYGFIQTVGWVATVYLIIFILGLFLRDFCQETIGEK